MAATYNYICPTCSKECSVAESLVGQNVLCPHCSVKFFATPPEQPESPATTSLPEKLPFFKFSRRKILAARMRQLIQDGELDENDAKELDALTASLRLNDSDLSKVRQTNFLKEFDPIKRRTESTFMLTDEDLAQIHSLEKKYAIQLTLAGNNEIFRAIYLLESKAELPAPISTGVMLDSSETAYFSIPTAWHQTRVRNRGYAGTSFSVPTGIKGVRFRFGNYTPIRSEELTQLSSGTLYVTSKRLLFDGDARSTNVGMRKIIDGQVFSDAVKIEKSTGKPDFFSMDAARARFILSLIGVLK
jgi:DNA-directed RNA polymerase subunit RPC12/RpoP